MEKEEFRGFESVGLECSRKNLICLWSPSKAMLLETSWLQGFLLEDVVISLFVKDSYTEAAITPVFTPIHCCFSDNKVIPSSWEKEV